MASWVSSMGSCRRNSREKVFSSFLVAALCFLACLQRGGADSQAEAAPEAPSAPASATQDSLSQEWSFPRPLRICSAAIEDFGSRCNGAASPYWEGDVIPKGEVPANGWCAAETDFCGYDIEVWTCVLFTPLSNTVSVYFSPDTNVGRDTFVPCRKAHPHCTLSL